jgi:hypothetical protein
MSVVGRRIPRSHPTRCLAGRCLRKTDGCLRHVLIYSHKTLEHSFYASNQTSFFNFFSYCKLNEIKFIRFFASFRSQRIWNRQLIYCFFACILCTVAEWIKIWNSTIVSRLMALFRKKTSDVRTVGKATGILTGCFPNARLERYSRRDQTVRFAYVTSLQVERKQTHILCKRKTSPTCKLRQRATKCCHCEIIVIVWTVYASLSATPPTPLLPLPFSSNRRGTQGFASTTESAKCMKYINCNRSTPSHIWIANCRKGTSSVIEEYQDGENSCCEFFGTVPLLQFAIHLSFQRYEWWVFCCKACL